MALTVQLGGGSATHGMLGTRMTGCAKAVDATRATFGVGSPSCALCQKRAARAAREQGRQRRNLAGFAGIAREG